MPASNPATAWMIGSALAAIVTIQAGTVTPAATSTARCGVVTLYSAAEGTWRGAGLKIVLVLFVLVVAGLSVLAVLLFRDSQRQRRPCSTCPNPGACAQLYGTYVCHRAPSS